MGAWLRLWVSGAWLRLLVNRARLRASGHTALRTGCGLRAGGRGRAGKVWARRGCYYLDPCAETLVSGGVVDEEGAGAVEQGRHQIVGQFADRGVRAA